MLDYTVFDRAKAKTLKPSVKTNFSLFFIDAETTDQIVNKFLNKEFEDFDIGALLDEYDRHSYFQVDLRWALVRQDQLHAAITARKSELRENALHEEDVKRAAQDPATWLLGEFSTKTIIGEETASLIRIVCGFVIRSLLRQPHMIVETNGRRTVLQKSKGKPRYRTIYLSDVAKRYVHSRDYQPGDGGGWKMPEHEVRRHMRRLSNGKIVMVRGHKRGDPTIERKTLPVQIKL